jgi:hypothetical protein
LLALLAAAQLTLMTLACNVSMPIILRILVSFLAICLSVASCFGDDEGNGGTAPEDRCSDIGRTQIAADSIVVSVGEELIVGAAESVPIGCPGYGKRGVDWMIVDSLIAQVFPVSDTTALVLGRRMGRTVLIVHGQTLRVSGDAAIVVVR